MAKTIVALYDSTEHAQRAVRDLVDSGIQRDNISLMATQSGSTVTGSDAAVTPDVTTSGAAEGAGVGAGIGAALGGIGGLLVGLGALAIPGIGPVLAAGPLAAALSGIAGAGAGAIAGGATGGLIGALTDMGVNEEQAGYYAEGIRRGGTLVSVRSDDLMATRAVDIMNRHNPIDVKSRASQWRESGWSGFDSNAGPYSGSLHSTTAQDRDTIGYSPEIHERDQGVSGAGFGTGAGSYSSTGGSNLSGSRSDFSVGSSSTTGSQTGYAHERGSEYSGRDYSTGSGESFGGSSSGIGASSRTSDYSSTSSGMGSGSHETGAFESDQTSSSDLRSGMHTSTEHQDTSHFGTDATSANVGLTGTQPTGLDRDFQDRTGMGTMPPTYAGSTTATVGTGESGLTSHESTEAINYNTNIGAGANVGRAPEDSDLAGRITNAARTDDIASRGPEGPTYSNSTLETVGTGESGLTSQENTEAINYSTNIGAGANIGRIPEDSDEAGRLLNSNRTFDTYETGFRTHFDTNYANRGFTYNSYMPAYRYGYELGGHESYRGREWNDIEMDVRRDWETRHPDNAWDDVKDAVRHAWMEVRNAFR